MTGYYYLDQNNSVCGPHSLEELQQLLAQGVIAETTYVAREGDVGWKHLSEELAAAPPTPVTKPPHEIEALPTPVPAGGGPTSSSGTKPPAEPTKPPSQDLPFELTSNQPGSPARKPGAAPVPKPVAAAVPVEAAMTWPWDPRPNVLAKVAQYDQARQGRSFACRCDEGLNSISKKDSRTRGHPGDFMVYPDLVAVRGKRAKGGLLLWLVRAILMLVQMALMFINMVLSLVTLNLPEFVFLFASLIISVVVFVVTILLLPILNWLDRKRLAMIAKRILADPRSSYAIKKLFQFTPLIPRYWAAGDLHQVVRVNSRSLFGTRNLVLLVQDNPLPRKAGCAELLLANWVARRRVYLLRLPKDQADAVAQEAAKVLGLTVTQADYKRGKLVLQT